MRFRDLFFYRPDDDEGIPAEPEPERPEWLDPTFATPEDQAKAYASARSEMSRVQSELDRVRKDAEREREQLLEAFQAQTAPTQQGYQGDPLVQAYARSVGIDEQEAAQALAIQMQLSQAAVSQVLEERFGKINEQIQAGTGVSREVAMRLAEQEVAPQFGDRWGEIAPRVSEAIRAQPGLLPEQGNVETYAAILSSQAKLVEYERLKSEAEAFERERREKLGAQTLGGDTARAHRTDTDEKQAEWDRVKQADTGSVPW